jgi:hypothetical protein
MKFGMTRNQQNANLKPILKSYCLKKKTSAFKPQRFISSFLLPKSKNNEIQGVPFDMPDLLNSVRPLK